MTRPRQRVPGPMGSFATGALGYRVPAICFFMNSSPAFMISS